MLQLLAPEGALSKCEGNGILKYGFIRNVYMFDGLLFSLAYSCVCKNGGIHLQPSGTSFFTPAPFQDSSTLL
jgi:hypothetical protein